MLRQTPRRTWRSPPTRRSKWKRRRRRSPKWPRWSRRSKSKRRRNPKRPRPGRGSSIRRQAGRPVHHSCRHKLARFQEVRRPQQEKSERDPLRRVERPSEQIALLVIAEELHDEARGGVQHQVKADDGARRVRLLNAPVEHGEDGELREGFIELGRMKRHAERHAD